MDRQTFSSGLSKAPIFELSLEGLKLTHYQLTYDSRSTRQIKEFLLTDHDRYPVIKVEFERSSSTVKTPVPSPIVGSAPGGSSLPGEFSVPRSATGGGANARVSFVPIAGAAHTLQHTLSNTCSNIHKQEHTHLQHTLEYTSKTLLTSLSQVVLQPDHQRAEEAPSLWPLAPTTPLPRPHSCLHPCRGVGVGVGLDNRTSTAPKPCARQKKRSSTPDVH